MGKKRILSKEEALIFLKKRLVSELEEGSVEILISTVERSIQNLVPYYGHKKLSFQDLAESTIKYGNLAFEKKSIDDLKNLLLGLFVSKPINKVYKFANETQGIFTIMTFIVSVATLMISIFK